MAEAETETRAGESSEAAALRFSTTLNGVTRATWDFDVDAMEFTYRLQSGGVLNRKRDGTRAPVIWQFPDSGEAYDMSQCRDEIVHGDVLWIPSERVAGVLDRAWPCVEPVAGRVLRPDVETHLDILLDGVSWQERHGGELALSGRLAAVLMVSAPF